MEFQIGLFYGFMVGATVVLVLSLLAMIPAANTDQFVHDCKVMAHGKVSNHLCVKGNTILFHQ